MNKVSDAKKLLAGASSFFQGLKHRTESQEEGLGEEHFMEDWRNEHKRAFMYSGCKDDQTSADASISGEHVGAMSWAFLQTMKTNPNQSYLQVRSTLPSSFFFGNPFRAGTEWDWKLWRLSILTISTTQVLQNTRQVLKDRYEQVPQLSVGYEMDLNEPLTI